MLGKAQLAIVIITIILMVLCFSMLIWSFKQAHKEKPWPPVNQSCPDYWEVGKTGYCKPYEGNTGTCPVSYNAYKEGIKFGSNTCQMYNWTQGSTGLTAGIYLSNGTSVTVGCTGVKWDGISYGYGVNNACYVPPST